MQYYRRVKNIIIMILVFAVVMLVFPMQASGEVKPIEQLNSQLENITKEEKAVLEDLFTLEQEIGTFQQEEDKIKGEIEELQGQIDDLGQEIKTKQADYDKQLDILKQVLVGYQRSGPASSLESLLEAKNLSSFIKSLNIMKDISHNVNELLSTLEAGKQKLQEKKDKLSKDQTVLSQKEEDLQATLHKKQDLQKQQKDYLASLQENEAYYTEQLNNVTTMWESSKKLFPDISNEITQIIGAGYFKLEDLNLQYGFFSISGSLSEDTFNRVLSENSKQTQTTFYFEDGHVRIEVPEEHLSITGNFVITDNTAIQFVASEGTFYDMPLEPESIDELFQNGPLKIDFKSIAEDMITIDFKIKAIESTRGSLNFEILPQL